MKFETAIKISPGAAGREENAEGRMDGGKTKEAVQVLHASACLGPLT